MFIVIMLQRFTYERITNWIMKVLRPTQTCRWHAIYCTMIVNRTYVPYVLCMSDDVISPYDSFIRSPSGRSLIKCLAASNVRIVYFMSWPYARTIARANSCTTIKFVIADPYERHGPSDLYPVQLTHSRRLRCRAIYISGQSSCGSSSVRQEPI